MKLEDDSERLDTVGHRLSNLRALMLCVMNAHVEEMSEGVNRALFGIIDGIESTEALAYNRSVAR